MFYKDEFKNLRVQKKIARAALAREIGKSDKTLMRWEEGINVPTEYNIRILAKVIGVAVNEISDLSDKVENTPLYYKKLSALDKAIYDISDKTETEKQQILIQLQKQVEVLTWESRNLENDKIYMSELVNSFNFFVYAKDKQLRFLYINNYFASYFNLTQKSIIYGKRNSEIWSTGTGNAWNELTALEKQVKETGQAVTDAKIPIYSSTSIKGTGLASIKPLLDGAKKVTGITGIILDITSDELGKEKYFYMESVLNKLDHVIWIFKFKPFEHYLYINDAFQKIFNISKHEMYSKLDRWLDFVIKEDRKIIKEAVRPDYYDFVYRIKRNDGKIRKLHHYIYNDKINDDEVSFGIIRDITGQKITSEQNEYDKKTAYEKGVNDGKIEIIKSLRKSGVNFDYNL
ncbi:MAG TPA: PAS domain-containing protein [Victivallales bacterium]|nr:PAS domain-containing protein [Victivallales bacterium]